MKYFSSLLFLLLWVSTVFGQTVTIDEDFSDEDYTNNPSWTDPESKHVVNASNMLQLDAPEESSEATITTPSDAAYGEWEIFVELGFNPSSFNLSRFYIISDGQDIKGDVNGYFIEIGGSDRKVSLHRQDGNTTTTIIDGTDDLINSDPVTVRIRVTRDLNGNWELFTDASGGTSFTSQGTTTDETYATSDYIGLFSDYTSTRHDLFEYDDIKITKITPPLDLQSVSIEDNQSFDVTFNQNIDDASIQNTDFSINNGIGNPNPPSVSGQVVTFSYDTPLDGGDYTLTISDEIQSQSGNSLSEPKTYGFTIFDSFEEGDIVINEFMFDPPPGDFNFDDEYVEIRNTTDKIFNMQNWLLGNDSSFEEISSNTLTLRANEFLVIAADSTALKQVFGEQHYFEPDNFPGLVNSGDAVRLQTNEGTLVDSLTYTSDWGGTDVALERRSASTPSIYKENWGDSPNPDGGTPGVANEVSADTSPPELVNLTIVNDQTLEIAFSERLENGPATNTANFSLDNGINVTNTQQIAADSVQLSLGSALQNADTYQLTIDNQKDIFGNTASTLNTSFTYYNPSPVDSGDVAINEFMAAPPSISSEYVELYNHSDKSLDLQGWTLSDAGQNQPTITNSQFIVPPDSFVVIAKDNTLESNYPDIAMIVMSGLPSLNNGGDTITIRDSNGTLLDSLTYDSDWGDDEMALERRTVDVSGKHQSNWGNAPNGFGTPGSSNEIEADDQSPILDNLIIRNSQELLLTFSEYLDETTSGNTDNFTISDNSVTGAQFAAPDSIFLTLENKLQNARDYALSVDNIEDIFGNTISPTDTSFTFYEVTPVDSGDVAINEFVYNPPSGNTEYIELYNHSDKSLDIQNWSLSDNRESFEGTITTSQFIVPPDSFVVIAPDNTIESEYPDISLVTMGSFPALNNSGDQIIIRDQNGALLDSLEYTSDWGGDEIALERRTVSISGTPKENWGDSPNPNGGTPGFANEVETDNTPPFFEQLHAVDATTLQLIFDEKIMATDKQNYQISPSRDIQLVMAKEDTVKLFLNQELVSEQTYEVTASNISDIFNNTLSGATRSTTFLRIDDAQPGDIVINEIMYDPGDDEADFIELYNTSDKNFDLSGWRVGDSSNETSFNGGQLTAESYIVLTGNQTFANSTNNSHYVSGFPALNNNSADAVYIKNNQDQIVDSLYYSQSWGGSEGNSLERKDPQAASNDASNWQTNTSNSGISAGAQNVTFQEDTSPPEIIFSKILSNNRFEVRFSEFIRLTDDVSFYNGEQQLEVAQFDSTNANVIFLESPATKEAKNSNSTTLRAENLSDVKGNTTSSSDISIAQPLQQGDLVINEIMFNPLADADDNLPDQSEYIELRNTQDFAISLEGLFLHDEPDENGEIRDIQPVSTTAKWVPSQGHVLVHADEATDFEESQTASFFDFESPTMQSIIRADRSSLSLASSDDAIYIADSTGATIDSVFYDETWHNPNIIDTRGVALERLSPGGPSNDDTNWGSSVNAKGGTPNKENSLYQENANIPEETGISFTPNPFSPDNDGYEDNLFINYKLDQQDYLIKVRIYDRYGRLVRELADGKKAGLEGQLIWNGRKDDGSRNRIGIYIVVFEAYDSASGEDRSFKKTVVLARKLN